MKIHGLDIMGTEPSIFVDDALLTAKNVLDAHKHPVVTVSGGSDSDVMIDLISRTGRDNLDKCSFVFVNTGLEYQATLKHLDYLEDEYGISIDRVRAKISVPLAVRRTGIPVFSKYISGMLQRLQKVGFDWSDDRPLDTLIKDYPLCIQGLKWWTGYYDSNSGKGSSMFSVYHYRLLKEYIMDNPPDFRINNRCCEISKKKAFYDALRKYDSDLNIMGVRRAEGGIRSQGKTCYNKHSDGPDVYRPIFWFSDQDKAAYCQQNGVIHSDCYRVWGLKRTGCTGCPYNPRHNEDQKKIETYEPKMAHAAKCVFGRAYEYQNRFHEYRRETDLRTDREQRGLRTLDEWYRM